MGSRLARSAARRNRHVLSCRVLSSHDSTCSPAFARRRFSEACVGRSLDPKESGADPKRTRRRRCAHAKFLQEPPIAVLSVFKGLGAASKTIRVRRKRYKHYICVIYDPLEVRAIRRLALSFVPERSIIGRRRRGKFPIEQRAIPQQTGVATTASKRNGVIIRRHGAHYGKRKQGGRDSGTGMFFRANKDEFEKTGRLSRQNGDRRLLLVSRGGNRPERLEAPIREGGARAAAL